MNWEAIGFVKASGHRSKVLAALLQKEHTPKELQIVTGLHFSQVSLLLRELIGSGLVECLNEESRKGRLHALTSAGRETISYIQGSEIA